MSQSEKVKAIAEILKKRFTSLSLIDVIDLAFQILEAIEEDD